MIFNCLIVEDEPIAQQIVESYISKNSRLNLLAIASNTNEARKYIDKQNIDLLFLDIKMPGTDGLTFLKSLSHRPVTILTTAYRNHALEGFDLGVIDYLVKPIKPQRFQQAVTRAVDILNLRNNSTSGSLQRTAESNKEIVIKSGTKHVALTLGSISHIKGLKDYCIVYANGNEYFIKGYIKLIEKQFHPEHFLRVHKSFIVAKSKIKIIQGDKIEIDDFEIPIGNHYKNIVIEFFKRLQ
jgi:DNA-binding LytR/AlgR family response regulator